MTKQLLQQALDYVENVPDDRCWGNYRDHHVLEEALRAAIAAAEPEPAMGDMPLLTQWEGSSDLANTSGAATYEFSHR